MSDKTVVVPPGQSVNVLHPADLPNVGYLPCGLTLLDFGKSGSWIASSHKFLDLRLKRPQLSALIILQSEMIDLLDALGETKDFFDLWRSQRAAGLSAVWVLPFDASTRSIIVQQLRSCGFGVHASAPDGACFVEVHKPDGSITIGMPGAALS